MLRLLLLGSLVYGMVIGLRDGWLIIKWSQLFHNIGFSQVDPEKPVTWSEFVIDSLEKDLQQQKDDF